VTHLPTYDPDGFASRMRQSRDATGLTVEQVADASGYDADTIARWEAGGLTPDEWLEQMNELADHKRGADET
jgi:transcriptional regulator with XRE-family HTH domain